MSTVWFMVDDSDPRLNYSGQWDPIFDSNSASFSNSSSMLAGGIFNDTLHLSSDKVSISFWFNGSSYVGVYGSQLGYGFPETTPQIQCLLDGAAIWSGPIGPFNQKTGDSYNSILYCSAGPLNFESLPGEHELPITAIGAPWYFDYITYESLANPVLDGEILQAGSSDIIDASNYSMLIWEPGWSFDSGQDSASTNIHGSQVVVKFNGTSVSLYGSLLSNVSNVAAYEVDGQAPVQLSDTSDNESKQLLFTASNLSIGEHIVAVTFNGSESDMPLAIDYFYIQSLTLAQQGAVSGSSAPSPGPVEHSNHRVTLAAVLGSIIPTVLMAVVIVWYYGKLKQRKAPNPVIPFDPLGLTSASQSLPAPSPHCPKKGSLSHSLPTDTVTDEIVAVSLNTRRPGNGSSTNLMTLKYEQRVATLQDLIRQRDKQLAEGSTQQQRLLTVHTDSGLRLTEEIGLGMDHEVIPMEVPPGYTVE
ncbi:hypothetical protein GYMLUDRAFT_243018 [Collybiopsis luxurians FD-317 M1]|uniref:Uncharacterized protein n=1 Tax=Collybiopsis luxurians FD-317 M1 TaxID=944289 RepID=A0A0D0C0Z1_9AGAR|nr:hypothetical protein GYMLUDRAFT_243018 [Collybiopsis luxurians FD-317 M1]